MSGKSFDSVPAMFLHRIQDTPKALAYLYPVKDDWKKMTWAEAGERVRAIAGGLHSFGLGLEERCAILSSTRLEWILADLGVLGAGGATTTIYPSNTPEECEYIINDSQTQYVFAENDDQVAKLLEIREQIPQVKHVINFDGGESEDGWVITLKQLEELGDAFNKENPEKYEAVISELKEDHLSTLIYTSGTTGKPKGVELLHRSWVYEGKGIHDLGILSASDLQYLWLPLSHSFGKVLEASQIYTGYPTAVDGRIPKLVDNLAVVRPTFMAAAPRIFEKVYNKVVTNAQGGGAIKYSIFKWAVKIGSQVSKLKQKGKEPSGLLAIQAKLAHKLVFSKLQERFGGRLKFFISGSAPLSRELAEFFHAADILILEGYGLTESSAASFVNLPESYKFGTVGLPLPGTEVKIAEEDGEILIKGPGVLRGYHNMPEVTAETLKDGWLMTGDIGELDADGFLKITDRKKDLIKTSGGKYVAPQALEGTLKSLSPYISQVLVHGNKRNFCTALVTIDEESIAGWAEENGLSNLSYEALTKHEKVIAMVQEAVDELNSGLARYETIKKFAILPKDLTVEDGEMTASLKVKRKVIEKKYMSVLDSFYEGSLSSL